MHAHHGEHPARKQLLPLFLPAATSRIRQPKPRRGYLLRTATPWSPHRRCRPRASQGTRGYGRSAEAVVISGSSGSWKSEEFFLAVMAAAAAICVDDEAAYAAAECARIEKLDLAA